MIKVGDAVKVTRKGLLYSTYEKFFEDFDFRLAVRYQFKCKLAENENHTYYVYGIGEHKELPFSATLAIIGTAPQMEYSKIYLIQIEGIEPVKKKMTIEEIEEELGYSIEIV